MMTYRKGLVICLVALTVIGTASYNLLSHHQSQIQPPRPDIVIGAESVIEDSPSNPDIGAVDISTSARSLETTTDLTALQTEKGDTLVTLSGWVGTEFGEYIGGGFVALHSPGLKLHYSTFTDGNGNYRLSEIQPGHDYIIRLTPSGPFKPYYRSPVHLLNNEEVHNILLEAIPRGLLSGTITDPYGRPVSDVELLIYTNDSGSWTSRVVSDSAGVFNLPDFPQGKFHIKSSHQQNLRIRGLYFDPENSQPFWLMIDLGPYSVSGRVHDESGLAFDGVELSLYWEFHDNNIKFSSTRMQSADANGWFEFTGIGPGSHEITISAWRGEYYKRTISRQINVGIDAEELIVELDTR